MKHDAEHAAHLFAAYFHQDCLVDDPDWEGVVIRFKDSESFDSVRRTQAELEQLRETWSESDFYSFLFGFPLLCFYDPRPDGLTVRAWVREIVHLLAGAASATPEVVAISRARRKAMSIARNVLAGVGDAILASRELRALRFSLGVGEDDPDFTVFVAIDSETDSLPIGPDRALWSTEALARLENEVIEARRWANTQGRQAFENVLRRFGGADT